MELILISLFAIGVLLWGIIALFAPAPRVGLRVLLVLGSVFSIWVTTELYNVTVVVSCLHPHPDGAFECGLDRMLFVAIVFVTELFCWPSTVGVVMLLSRIKDCQRFVRGLMIFFLFWAAVLVYGAVRVWQGDDGAVWSISLFAGINVAFVAVCLMIWWAVKAVVTRKKGEAEE